jgi:Arc/MetJ-type ribon-helix-helix transcriptional regulator
MSFQLRTSVAEAIRTVVNAGEAPNASGFVEEVVRERLRERRRKRVYAAYGEASEDPLFIAEMARTDDVFDTTIGDGLP